MEKEVLGDETDLENVVVHHNLKGKQPWVTQRVVIIFRLRPPATLNENVPSYSTFSLLLRQAVN